MHSRIASIDVLTTTPITDPSKAWDTQSAKVFNLAPCDSELGALQLIGDHALISGEVCTWLHHLPKRSFDWQCYTSTDISISGIGTMWLDGQIVVQEDLMPRHWKALLFDTRFLHQFSAERETTLDKRELEDVCMPFSIWGFDNYGHVLIDALPRALAAKRLFGDKLKLLVRHDTPEWVYQICSKMGIQSDCFAKFDARREAVHLKRGIFPAFPRQNGCIHTYVATLLDECSLLATPQGHQKRKLFFTRQSLPDSRKRERNCLNESLVCKIAESDFGFEIIRPEDLSWECQVSLVRSSSVLAGLAGSALHTTIFVKSNIAVASIGFNAMAQAQICRLRGQRYAAMNRGIPTSGNYEVDIHDLRDLLSSVS